MAEIVQYESASYGIARPVVKLITFNEWREALVSGVKREKLKAAH